MWFLKQYSKCLSVQVHSTVGVFFTSCNDKTKWCDGWVLNCSSAIDCYKPKRLRKGQFQSSSPYLLYWKPKSVTIFTCQGLQSYCQFQIFDPRFLANTIYSVCQFQSIKCGHIKSYLSLNQKKDITVLKLMASAIYRCPKLLTGKYVKAGLRNPTHKKGISGRRCKSFTIDDCQYSKVNSYFEVENHENRLSNASEASGNHDVLRDKKSFEGIWKCKCTREGGCSVENLYRHRYSSTPVDLLESHE